MKTPNFRLSDEQLVDEMLILFIAGHETTANALIFIFFEISQNPEAEEKLKKKSLKKVKCSSHLKV